MEGPPQIFSAASQKGPEETLGSGVVLGYLSLFHGHCFLRPLPPLHLAYLAAPVQSTFPDVIVNDREMFTVTQLYVYSSSVQGLSGDIQLGSVKGMSPGGPSSYFQYPKEFISE